MFTVTYGVDYYKKKVFGCLFSFYLLPLLLCCGFSLFFTFFDLSINLGGRFIKQ